MWRKAKQPASQAFASCSVCSPEISLGESYRALQWASETFAGQSVNVQEAEVIAYYCRTCAQGLDFSRAQVPQK